MVSLKNYKRWETCVQKISSQIKSPDQHQRITDEEWDILIVLDACRWDVLNEIADYPIGYCTTPETTTSHWVKEAEKSRVFEDMYIVTANGHYRHVDLGARKVEWTSDAWDHSLGNIPPEPVFERVDEVLEENDPPIVAHVLPPHAPYIAKVGDTWVSALRDQDQWNDMREDDSFSARELMAAGEFDIPRSRRAYRASVASTWKVTSQYIADLVDKKYSVALTADHGECFGTIGDYFLYEHPAGCHVPPLNRVPWEVFSRNEIGDDVETLEEHLQALGYTI